MPENTLLRGKRVLIVDDEPDILEVVKELLDMCEVVTALTFKEAKLLLETQDFHIAVLDIMGVDGYGLLEICTKRNIPAVMLTAHAFTSDNLVKSIREGACSYIPKEEISDIAKYLSDALAASQRGDNPWGAWQKRLPSSYFGRRWGVAWRDADKEFWERFKVSIGERKNGQ